MSFTGLYPDICFRGSMKLSGGTIEWQEATRKKKTTNKQLYKYGQFRSFSSRLAKPETTPQIELRLSMNFVKNFCLRLTIRLDTDLISNTAQHSCTISTDPVLNIFISSRVYIKSSNYFLSPFHRLSPLVSLPYFSPFHLQACAF